MIDPGEMTLHEVLAALGMRSRKRPNPNHQGREVWRDDERVIVGTAHEVWKWLHTEGLITRYAE